MRHALLVTLLLTFVGVAAPAAEMELDAALAEASLVPANLPLSIAHGEAGATLTFDKDSPERQFVGAVLALPVITLEPLSLRASVRLTGVSSDEVRLACVLWTEDGQAWYALGLAPARAFEEGGAEVSLPLSGLTRAAFSFGDSPLEWAQVRRMWLGAVVDAVGEGSLTIGRVALSSEPFRASEPLVLTEPGRPGSWEVGSDSQVTWDLSYPETGPDGRSVTEIRFRFPGGSHMFVTPSIPVPAPLSGYNSMRLVYQSALPPGIDGLLVMLAEDAAQFQGPAPPATGEEWSEAIIDLADFRLGAWSTDDDGALDLAGVGRVFVGAHGVADGGGGEGVIRIASIEFLP